jgi:hypothetical protein
MCHAIIHAPKLGSMGRNIDRQAEIPAQKWQLASALQYFDGNV